jgi:ABC-type phosphate transport system substrate-binding protein
MSDFIGAMILMLRARNQLIAMFAMSLLLSSPAHAEVRVYGATTVAFGLMNPQKATIEKLSGVQLTILPSSTTHGLGDLAKGNADIAMLAEPLESAAEAVNKKIPGLVNLADFANRHVGDAFVQFIVHPSNPVTNLSKGQLADLYSGKTKNWAELGGDDVPVLVVVEPTSSPYRMIKDELAISYTPAVTVVQNTNQTAVVVAQARGAISNISTAHDMPERGQFKVLSTEVKLPLHLYLAFRKDARQDVMRVIEASVEIGKP